MSNHHSKFWTLDAATRRWAKKCLRTDSNTLPTLISHSPLSSKCKNITKKKYPICNSSRWMLGNFNSKMVALMLLSTRPASTQLFVETIQAPILNQCWMKYIGYCLQQGYTSASPMASQRTVYPTSIKIPMIGLYLRKKLQNQRFQHQL